METRADALKRFYDLLEKLKRKLGGTQRLAECHRKMGWPQRGVYFFFESEKYQASCRTGPRVVRVGTHAVKRNARTCLWDRLNNYRGNNAGGGSFRNSQFRYLVGEAIINEKHLSIPSWSFDTLKDAVECFKIDKKTIKRNEENLEKEITKYICSMPFLWVEINDEPGPESARRSIERQSIALLSNCTDLDPPKSWLGSHSHRKEVAESGLWNIDHVGEEYGEEFLQSLEKYISGTTALRS